MLSCVRFVDGETTVTSSVESTVTIILVSMLRPLRNLSAHNVRRQGRRRQPASLARPGWATLSSRASLERQWAPWHHHPLVSLTGRRKPLTQLDLAKRNSVGLLNAKILIEEVVVSVR